MFGCSRACFNRAVDCQTCLSLFRSQHSFCGDFFHGVYVSVEAGKCGEILAYMFAFLVLFYFKVSICRNIAKLGLHA